MAAAARASDHPEVERSLAWIRVAALPVIALGERLADAPQETTGAFPYVLGALAVYAGGALALSYSGRRRTTAPAVYVGLDLAFISALSLASGGETSEVRRAFFLPPVEAAFLLRPALTALVSAAAVGAYLAVGLADPPAGELADPPFVFAQALYIAWFGIAATLFSAALTARTRRVGELAAERGRLVAQAIDAAEQERRRISEALHDDAVQNLLAARLDLAAARAGDPVSLGRVGEEIDRTLAQLRESVADLHPIALEQGGLAAALGALARRWEARGGFRATVRVEPDATGLCDRLLMSLGRELLANAAKHARASRVSLALERQDEELVLEVADDGVGIAPGRAQAALREGHIGLASALERVRALGGRLEIESEAGRGTVVRARIPTTACEATAGASSPGVGGHAS